MRRRNATERLPREPVEMIITDALIRRFLLRAGFRTSSQTAAAHTRQHLCAFLKKLVHTMFPLVEHGHRMNFCLADVVNACRVHGIRLYGYDDVCNLERVSGEMESYHVTEMVETRTTFGGPDTWDDEPDMEPGARFKKTDFVVNQAAFDEDDEDDSDGDDSEWSWYGESDADSDSEDEDVEMDSDNNRNNDPKPWQRPQHGNQLVESLKAAQVFVDEQLLQTDPSDDDAMDGDAAQGQGYFSDYDEVQEPATSVMQNEVVRKEDELWNSNNNLHEIDDDKAEQVLDSVLSNDDADQYTIPRQVFTRFFRSTLGNTLKISTVALSALHNVSEQNLHRELAQGVLSYQLQAIISEEKAAQENDLQEQLRQEREKVNKREQKIADLKAAFKAKELEMQHQIAQLQHQLRVQQQSSDDFHMQTPNRTPRKRKSPGKRKLTPNSKRIEIVRKEAVKSSTSPKSNVGSLRSKIQDYALRSKKTRVNPV